MIVSEIRDLFRLNVGDVNADRFSDTRVDQLMYSQVQQLLNQAEKHEITLNATTTTFGIANGASTAALPSDMKKAWVLERTDQADPLRIYFGTEDNKKYQNPQTFSPIPRPFIRGTTLIFEYALTEDMSFTLTYTAGLVSLNAFTTQFTSSAELTIVPFQHHPALSEMMAYKGLLGEGTQNRLIADWKEMYNKHMQELLNTFQTRIDQPQYGSYIPT